MDEASDACKAQLEERRKFGFQQLATVKAHQLKALIRLEMAVSAGDTAAVGVLSSQLAAINTRGAAEAKHAATNGASDHETAVVLATGSEETKPQDSHSAATTEMLT